jgi:N6-adenosine-specific RNA methylase IME4
MDTDMSTFRKFDDILHRDYGAILADPPWTFVTRALSGKGRSAEQHYPCMTVEDIKRLPVAHAAGRHAALFLWVPDPHLKFGLQVMEAWGFEYKTVAFTWVKLNKKSPGYFTGMGYWTRKNPEMCLFGTRGRYGAPNRLHKDVRQLIVTPRREHSRKPDEVYQRITRLLPGPYLELFGRSEAPGWDVWTNETKLFAVKQLDAA